MTPTQAIQLARAVHRWLAFQKLCGRDAVFSEGYLTHPIAEFVSAHHSGEIKPEYTLAEFKTGDRGRPKQVDFVLTTRNSGDVQAAIESKWVGDSAFSKQAIVDDLLRLERFRDPNRHVERFFLVGGLTANFKKNFLELNFRTTNGNKPFLRRLLPKTRGYTKVIKVAEASFSRRKFYRRFEREYGVEIPKGFSTLLHSYVSGDGIDIYLWGVQSSRGRRVFSPKLLKWPE